jgi:CheY-like chemotaxis protein
MSGNELLRRIRRFADAETLPCVVVSANALEPDIEAALSAGFASYITKPIDLEAVLATVDRYLLV